MSDDVITGTRAWLRADSTGADLFFGLDRDAPLLPVQAPTRGWMARRWLAERVCRALGFPGPE